MQPIDTNLQSLESKLTSVARDAKKPWVSRSADGLKSSIRVRINESSTEDTITISFSNYGLFLDAGVKGRLGKGVSQAGFFGVKEKPYQFRKAPKRELKKEPYPGYLMGIAPRPWVKSMVDAITKEVIKYEEENLPKEIKDKILADLKRLNPNFQGNAVTISVT
jgi:hypothetical protein